jgi:hypothetical protein
MVSVPGFLLRRLYVKGSLTNAEVGFEFQLMNSLGSGYSTKVWPLKVDGEDIPADRCYFIVDDRETPFSEVSPDNTFALEVNKAITVWADSAPLEPGVRQIEMAFDVPGLGSLRFDFSDEVADG